MFRPNTIGVRCLVEDKEGREILLVRHTYMYTNYWSAPGGGVKKFEKMEDVATREVKEEVGVDIYDIRFVGEYKTEVEFKKDCVSLCVAKTDNKNYKIDEKEILEARWFRKDNLPEKVFAATKNILEKLDN